MKQKKYLDTLNIEWGQIDLKDNRSIKKPLLNLRTLKYYKVVVSAMLAAIFQPTQSKW